jgi:prophage DNA circulation protein
MSWRDRLRPASFRGVPFSVATVESEYGRRQVTHQAALVDVPTAEDLGRAADSFQVEGFIVGEDYDQARDQLIVAIRDTAGPGRLVHPFQGEKTVIASGFRIREDSAEQRMCRFTVTFGEAGELSQPTDVIDGPNMLSSRADAIQDASELSFVDKFVASGFPQYVRDAATDTFTSLTDYLATPTAFLSEAYTDATGVFNTVSGIAGGAIDFVADSVAEYQSFVSTFDDDLGGLLGEPGDLASRVTDLIRGVRNVFGSSAGSILSGLLSRFDREGPTPERPDSPVLPPAPPLLPGDPVPTPSRVQVSDNNAATVSLVRQVAVSELAVFAVSQEYETLDTAVEIRDIVADLIDEEAETTPDDNVYTQLTQARAEVVQSLPAADQSPAMVVSYTPAATLPALVIAQTLYDNAAVEAQIVSRNRPRHPGFLTGGQPLQVLSDV